MKEPQFDNPGYIYNNFKVIRSVKITELQCTLRELVHLPTGAQVMHIANDDPENLFCLSFQTHPSNSNGVAHILEHTVLCGSKKYPVKDPFFAMTRRSLNTFMNALTGADFTCYPAASQEPKDFYNLLGVYLDAVFYPHLKELSFLQEGHRIEFSKADDPTSPLEYKGIVFNEMKGALSSATARLAEAVNQALFPDITYGNDSGGDPKVIPSLTYQELLDFHKKYYHPSHCLFYFYGDMPLDKHLDFIIEHALSDVSQEEPLQSVSPQPRFKEPKHIQLTYPLTADEDASDKTLIALAWLTCPVLNLEDMLALSLLEIILMDTDASPLKRALMDSGLCKQVSSYMETDYSEIPWVIVARGCPPHVAEQLEELTRNTLRNIASKGIPEEAVENALHHLEFYRTEISGDHAPFGLTLFFRSGLLGQHGADPAHGLMIHSLFETLRQHITKDPNYLGKLIHKYFLDNSHFARINLIPDKNLTAKELAEERAVLDKIQESLTGTQKTAITVQSQNLLDLQKLEEEADEDILPKIELEDVTQQARTFSLQNEKTGHLEVFYHHCFTNAIVYTDLVFDLPQIAQNDLPYLRLFTLLLTQMGAGGRTYLENLDYIQAHTGGISASLALNVQVTDFNETRPSIHLRGKALHRKVEWLMPLLYDFATSTDFTDANRIKEVVLKHYTGLQSSLNQNGLKYAISLSGSSVSDSSYISDEWYGLAYYNMVKKIAADWDTHQEHLVSTLKRLQNLVFCTTPPHLVITCDVEMYNQLKKNQFYGLQKIKVFPSATVWDGHYNATEVKDQGRIISTPVAFTAKSFKTIPYVHEDNPALNIASCMFDNITLHTRVREQGGAYGAGAVNNTSSGLFYFYSYRDPHISSTIDAFDEAVRILATGEFDESDIEEAKLEMVQAMDSPVSPGSRGDLAYGWMREGKTLERRQKFRDAILNATRDDIIRAVKDHIQPHMQDATTIVFAGKDLLEKEAKLVEKLTNRPFGISSV